ncbi:MULTISPECIES: serine hydrolase [unclassified Imperialibacter]|uniref:serine hydrolase domain-containing protein n=1 Tax=unclassified Imperialibacter TaxID=2629706 RepID=UPI00125BDBE0|nr:MULTISPECIES: serine hydrolase domain-containing protein [unclassified Imperialibacter]CAD5254184.1 Class A beta-lactamase-related serine hydrolase [Imperialibacter sp. 75]CAD5262623.1 Class A beta-lactamase-related serine hydrolase [Imperialibacter sp. 89]VVT35286.1 CubicO group peptidase, beta-lactamase class C family [Imperialibacter sp. EC-SDR9]
MKRLIIVALILAAGHGSFGQSNSKKELETKMDELFESYTQYNRFVGNVLVSKNDQIAYQKSFGYADLERGKKNTGASIFSIASLTKSLTAVGIMKLVENGKLTLETPLSTYFPHFMPEHSGQITIQHLLNNSSGMQANIGRIDDAGNGLMPGIEVITIDELLEKFGDSKLNFEPGTAYEYNNFGYVLLANIIEKVSGYSYPDFMEQAVFKPAGMKNTAAAASKNVGQIAYPYFGLGMETFEKFTTPFHTSWLMGAADVTSTTTDLYKFMQALDHGTLLTPASVDQLYTRSQEMGVNTMTSGLGWVTDQKEGEKWVYNSGLLPGYASMMGSLPEQNIKIIILSNATSVNPVTDEFEGNISFVEGEITDKMVALLLGKPVELTPVPTQISAGSFSEEKAFQLDDEHTIVIKNEGGKYFLETTGKAPWSVFTYAFAKDASEKNEASEVALFFAKAWSTQQFEGLSDYGNEQMKGFLGTQQGQDQLKGMWANFVNHAGAFQSYNIYKIAGEEVKNVHIRFHFESVDVGMVIVVNAEHKIQGMFMDDAVRTSHVTKVALVPVGENKFFIDGHRNGGMQDLVINMTDSLLTLNDGSEKFEAKIQTAF